MAEPMTRYVVYGLMFTDVWMQVGQPAIQKEHAEYLSDFLQAKGIEAMIQRRQPAAPVTPTENGENTHE